VGPRCIYKCSLILNPSPKEKDFKFSRAVRSEDIIMFEEDKFYERFAGYTSCFNHCGF
jgi:hypothetical protein